ncbi:MAG: carboxypeptidase regulatory-like domain-containing protein [Acidimicrobiia bacterium]|nr:carboxypeptidase regulatory-like domain-containing protein [Acidimicrobiia bacterium]
MQFVLSGADATFAITVTNTGDVDLANVVVSDPLAPACDTTVAALPAGASATINCTVNTVGSDFTNTGSVTADDPLSGQVSASDTADVDVISPAITIDKTPNSQAVLSGSDATFTITVNNTGDVDLTNVAVTDPLTPACDLVIGALAAGATSSYTCDAAGVTGDFVNMANVSADHPAGGSVADTDTASVDVIAPAITLTKSPNTQAVVSGGTANFTVEVSNPGDVTLTNVTIADPNAPGCDAVIPSLAAGASTSVSCSVTGVTSDFTNSASVVAGHPAGGTVSASDTADVTVLVPGIDLQKTPNVQTVVNGGSANFTITVTNTGAVDLTGVAVADGAVPACDNVIGALSAATSTSYACTASAVSADFTNSATVTGTDPLGGTVSDTDTALVDVIAPAVEINKTPDLQAVVQGGDANFTVEVANTGDVDLSNVIISDPGAPGCALNVGTLAAGSSTSVTCTVAGVAADFTNTASVAADDPLGNPLSASDSGDVKVLVPGIEIQKTPDVQTVGYGATVTFTITITNSGETDLTNVTVADGLVPACDTLIASLLGGASASYTCDAIDVTADMTNVVDVTADDPLGASVADSDSAAVDVITPVIDIEKTPDLQTVMTGADATFTITLMNTGDVTLSNVVVTDALAPACDATFASLTPGQVQSYSCSLTAVTADFVNTADVTAQDPLARPLSDSDTAAVDVIAPGIEIQKTPDTQTVLAGGDANFTITVTNTGAEDLTAVAVTDAAVPACDLFIGSLAAGAIQTYSCSAAGLGADLSNVAQVVATDPLLNTLSDSDDAFVDVISPAISISKTPDNQTVVQGGNASFTVAVSNTGDVDLTNVAVGDPSAPGCSATVGTLAAGTSATVACTVTGVTSGFTNTASVTGQDPLGNVMSASDTGVVTVLVPAVEVQKTPDIQTIAYGADATFTITVTNTGATALTAVTISDSLTPGCDAVIANLSPGASQAYSCTLTGATADLTNVADVIATTPAGATVSDSDTAAVDVIAPAIQVFKTPDTQAVYQGSDATFTIEVANTGDVDLVNVMVTDPAVPACDTNVGSLAAGSSASFTCTATSVTAGFTNTASVTAEDPLANPVADSATADVVVLVPGIDIQKTPDLQSVLEGGTATFTITVRNAGATPLSNVAVNDPLVPACDSVIGAMAIGAVVSFTCSTAAGASFVNTASVSAMDPAANPATDSDTATVTVIPIGDATGHVFIDVNADGVQQAGEPDLANLDVVITLADGSTMTVATNANGDWSVTGVAVGNITANVDEADSNFPTGHVLTTANDPQPVTVVAGSTVAGAPVGYAPTGSIAGVAWVDANGNGVRGGSEPRSGGIVVSLWNDTNADGSVDTVVGTRTTAADGSYLFDGLVAGTYQVRFSLPVTSKTTITNLGSDDTVDSDVNRAGRTGIIALAAGQVITNVDAGWYQPVSIGDSVWSDVDGDGVQDSGEPGAAGVTVIAIWGGADGVVGTSDDETYTATTDATGFYTFTGVPPGSFTVAAVVPAGAELTYGNDPYTLTTVSGAALTTIDFGLSGTAELGGVVWLDVDADGARDVGEPVLPGVRVDVVWAGPDGLAGTSDDVPYAVITDAQGRYMIEGLASGAYDVRVDTAGVAPGLASTYDLDGITDSFTSVTVAPGETADMIDFGYTGTGALDGVIWLDLDRNGLINGNEPRFGGVTLDATWAGPDGLIGTGDDVVYTLVTGHGGAYAANHLPGGTYQVRVNQTTLPLGCAASYDLDGVLDSQTVSTVPSGGTRSGVNFGYRGTASLGDYVWIDTDGDGVPDPDERGVADVTVIVTWTGPDGIFGTDDDVVFETVTDASGRYFIEGLPPGTYQVEVLSGSLPGGYSAGGVVTITLVGESVNLDGDIAVHTQGMSAPPATSTSQPLPQTGIDSDRLGWSALLMILFGGWLVVAASRRKSDHNAAQHHSESSD